MEIENHLPQIIEKLRKQAAIDGIQKKVVGAVIAFRGKLLVVIRSDKEHFMAGHAEIPGGGVEEEQGETILEALQRETKEETGLDVIRVLDYVGSFDYTSGSGRKTRQFNFLVETESHKVILDPEMEHTDHFWCTPDDTDTLDSYTMTDSMRTVITSIKLPNSDEPQ